MEKANLEHTDIFLNAHEYGSCKGTFCTLHKRSDHQMRAFPQHWRADLALMERTCPHGVGHPDPDELHLDQDGRGVHGCDGCCSESDDERV